MSELEELAAQVEAETTFMELEWLEIDEEHARELVAAPELERYAHMLEVMRLTKPHRLTEPEERLLTEKAVTGWRPGGGSFDEQLSALQCEFDGEQLDLAQTVDKLLEPDREVRRRGADAVTDGLAPGLRTRARILNVLLADHAVDDRLRSYPHWLAALNMENEASDESVQALVEAVVGRYDIARRWSRIKARALGLPKLCDYDRLAPVSDQSLAVEWEQARELVQLVYSEFSVQLGKQVARFFDERWIDAELRPGKVPGGYCMSTVPEVHPYVLINYTDRLEDVLTLAHELGHGLHFLLAAPRGSFRCRRR